MGQQQSKFKRLKNKNRSIVNINVPIARKRQLVKSLSLTPHIEIVKIEQNKYRNAIIGGGVGGLIAGAGVAGLISGIVLWLIPGVNVTVGPVAAAVFFGGAVGCIAGALTAKLTKIKGFWKGLGVGLIAGTVCGIVVSIGVVSVTITNHFVSKLSVNSLPPRVQKYFGTFLPDQIISNAKNTKRNDVIANAIGVPVFIGSGLVSLSSESIIGIGEKDKIINYIYNIICHEINDQEYHDFYCPISHELMQNPVQIPDYNGGQFHIYRFERSNIEQWFENNSTNPMTNQNFKNERGEDVRNLKDLPIADDVSCKNNITHLCNVIINAIFQLATRRNVV